MTADTADEPEKLGRYQLLHKLAHGGMATVYLATFSGPGGFKKAVALKRIHRHLADEKSFVDMFLDEARIASRIHHANVCAVNDFGESDGTYYIAMEYLLGEPLSRILRALVRNERVLSDPRHPLVACRIIADACEGLHAAHELRGRDGQLLGVVHRDISPQNLFVTFDGNVKVVDFGIARAEDRLHHTQGGQIKGKFSYMSPEQATGKPVDRRADVWSLGVVLWEIIATRRLFHGDGAMATLQTVIGGEIPPPSSVREDIDVPAEIDAVVLRALARDPEERYATARDLGRDLVQAMARSGTVVTAPDLSDWMNRLFPEGRHRAYELMEAIERSDPIDTVVSPTPISGPDQSAVRARERRGDGGPVRPAPVAALHDESAATMQTPAPTFPGAEAPRGRSMGLWGAVAGVVLALAVGGGWLLGRPGEPAGARDEASSPPAAVTSEDPPGDEGQAVAAGEEAAEAETAGEEEAGEAGAETAEAAGEAEAETAGEAEAGEAQRARRESRTRRARRRRAAAETPSEAPPPSEERPQATTGTVAIFTPGGWANVHGRGGRLLGQTPLRITLPSGSHDLELRPFGQPPGRRVRVEVTGGETARVVQPLSE